MKVRRLLVCSVEQENSVLARNVMGANRPSPPCDLRGGQPVRREDPFLRLSRQDTRRAGCSSEHLDVGHDVILRVIGPIQQWVRMTDFLDEQWRIVHRVAL